MIFEVIFMLHISLHVPVLLHSTLLCFWVFFGLFFTYRMITPILTLCSLLLITALHSIAWGEVLTF